MLREPYSHACISVGLSRGLMCSAQPDSRIPIAPPTKAPVAATRDWSLTAPRRRASTMKTTVAASTPKATNTLWTGRTSGPTRHCGTMPIPYSRRRREVFRSWQAASQGGRNGPAQYAARMAPTPMLKTAAAAVGGSALALLGYASLIERNAFVVREVTVPLLAPGTTPLRVLQISDIHMGPSQRRKQAWLRELAQWDPDLVVNTGDNLAHPRAVPAVVQALGDLLSLPGLFVFGSNDYFGPRLKNPANYLVDPGHRRHGRPLPWQDLRAAFTERGWLDMTHTRR